MKKLVSFFATLLLLAGTIMPAALARADATNLIVNPSVETANGIEPANWTPDSWGSSTTTFNYANGGHTGAKSLSINTTARTTGDAKWIPDAVTVTPSTSYTYTEYYQSNVATELDAEYIDASNNVSYAYLTAVPASTTWTPASKTFTTPATAVKVAVLHILAGVGALQTDDFSLTSGSTTPPPVTPPVTPPPVTPPVAGTNLITNPSFETANGASPASWATDKWGTNKSTFSYITTDGHTGTHSATVQTTTYTSGDAKWYFNAVAVQPNTKYIFSDYYKATTGTSLVAQYNNGSGVLTYKTLSAVAASTGWQQATTTFTTPATAKSMTIFHLIGHVGTLQIDDASLALPATTPPPPPAPTVNTVNITAPIANAQLSGNVTVTANATSTATVANVQFKLDGANLGNAVTTAPYQTSWNTTTATNGAHTLTAVITASDNTTATSSAVQVTVANQVAPPPPPPPAVNNLVSNPSVETVDPANAQAPLDWMTGNWGKNTAQLSYAQTGRTGTRSVTAQITSYTNGAAYWFFKSQPVTGGKLYDFSDYYKATVSSEIDVVFTMSDGSTQEVYLGDAFTSPNSWTKFEIQFAAPAGAVSATVIHYLSAVGTLSLDDVSLSQFSYQGFNRPIVSITDDDGYASFYNNGLPLLQKYDLTSTDYIISSYVTNAAGYMTSNMIKALHNAGNEIGSHSVNHPDLTSLTASQADSELKDSQTYLQNLLGIAVPNYAAPYGAYNNDVVTDAANYYQSYRTTISGYNAKNNFDRNAIMVQNLVNTTTLAEVQSWIAQAQATNTWLVLVYHQVDTAPSAGDYNTYPSDFDAQLQAIKSSGIAVETVAQALAELEPQL